MKIKEYIPLAIRTEVPRPILERYLHGTIGVCTEAAELLTFTDKANAKEELGDICWYLAIQFDALSQGEAYPNPSAELVYEGVRFTTEDIIIMAADSLDAVKKAWFYGRPVNESKIAVNARKTMLAVAYIARRHGLTVPDVLEANIAKLKVRYPDKFTSEHAYSRNLEAEKEAIKS